MRDVWRAGALGTLADKKKKKTGRDAHDASARGLPHRGPVRPDHHAAARVNQWVSALKGERALLARYGAPGGRVRERGSDERAARPHRARERALPFQPFPSRSPTHAPSHAPGTCQRVPDPEEPDRLLRLHPGPLGRDRGPGLHRVRAVHRARRRPGPLHRLCGLHRGRCGPTVPGPPLPGHGLRPLLRDGALRLRLRRPDLHLLGGGLPGPGRPLPGGRAGPGRQRVGQGPRHGGGGG